MTSDITGTMMANIHLARITIYPIKSLDGVDVGEAQCLPCGALANDRRFALVDGNGRVVNGKGTPAIHRIRAAYDLNAMTVRLHDTARDRAAEFSLIEDQVRPARWLSEALGVE